jgi:predicted DNA-binding antitoxin AbrB/MazE fold protein
MVRPIEAIYENGCLKLLKKVHLPEHIKVRIAILDKEDPSSMDMARFAQKGRAFDFLNNPDDDIYNLEDGEKVE